MGLGTESLISEVQDLLRGRLVIPSIQRGYVWRKSQVPALLDSLYRGYPVGSLLVWKTNIDVPLKQAAVLQDTQVQVQPAVLLDGQQRVTSLAKVIAPHKVRGPQLNVRFDLRAELFLNPSASERSRAGLLSVTELLGDAPQFTQILGRAQIQHTDPDYDELYARLRRVHEIRNYPFAVTTVDSDDYEEVADIFARVNSGGRRLPKGDLVYSAIAARWSEGLDTIEAFNDELDRQNFALDREAVLRLTGLLAGSGAQVIKLIDKKISGDDLKRAWSDTATALRYAVDFLKGECAIPRSAVLSSPNVVVTPAFFLFQRKNTVTEEETDFLRRWVYSAMGFSHYSNQVEGKLDAEARAIRTKAGKELYDDLTRRVAGPRSVGAPIEPDDLAGKGSSSSWFNLLYIAALRAGAKDWTSNQALVAVPMSSGTKIEFHHVFPRARVSKRFGTTLTNSIANLAFISGKTNRTIAAKLPANYLPDIPQTRLNEQWIPMDSSEWELDAFPEFLNARQALLAAVLNELLGLRPYARGAAPVQDAELPEDDDEIEPETEPAPVRRSVRIIGGRRSVSRHITECFEGLPPGAVLTVADIVATASSQYNAGEISAGAVAQRLNANDTPGVAVIAGSTPLAVSRGT